MKRRNSGIYKITSPTNKIYIGQSVNIDKRWQSYYKYYCNSQPLIYSSLKYYGANNHKFEIIELCDEENLSTNELKWFVHYKSLGYEMLNAVIPNTENNQHIPKLEKDKTFNIEFNNWAIELNTWAKTIFKLEDLAVKNNNICFWKTLADLINLKYLSAYKIDNQLIIQRNGYIFSFKMTE